MTCAYCGTSIPDMETTARDNDGDPVCEECIDGMTEEERSYLLPEEYQ